MSFGLFWLSSVVLSNFMFIVSVLRGVKDIVDEGYKISNNINKSDNIEQNNENILSYLVLFVPFLNILTALSFSALIIQDKDVLFDMFKSRNMLEEMTKEEIDEYSKKPTLLNALKVCIQNKNINEISDKEELTFKLSFEDIDGIIEYTFEKDDVKIVNSTIDSNKYNLNTQKNLVKAAIKFIYKREIIKFESDDELFNYYLSNTDKLLNRINDFKIMKEDQDKIKNYFLEFEFVDKYNEIKLNKEKIDNLEKEISTLETEENIYEKLELINKLKVEYKRLLSEAIIINNNLSNYCEDIHKIEDIKDEEVKENVKKHSNVMK